MLTPLSERGIDCKVKVGAHGSHGSIATVTLTGLPPERRATLRRMDGEAIRVLCD
jgi:fatty-acyl-CoA synthase